jgi:KUP system potassium uptake protein
LIQPLRSRHAALTLGALGVVYGDIGTSPLYAIRECFAGSHAIPVSAANVLGVLSLIVWSLLVIVSGKYLAFVMRADNEGEGGTLALVAAIRTGKQRQIRNGLVMLGLFGTALLYGDGMITPAISVLSAVEGLGVATNVFEPFLLPITVVILLAIFVLQQRGTGGIGALFGPVMIAWFLTLVVVALPHIVRQPMVLAAINPMHAIEFLAAWRLRSLATLGAVFLAVTGAESLYADMGHFGKNPIRMAWFLLVLPALIINYLGQGALLLSDPAAVEHPFYHLAPEWGLYPLVALSTLAAIIASQAVISGAFSITQQAIQLGYSPRLDIQHTSAKERGQVYIPEVNWALMLSSIALVLGFGSSTNLAAAYGMAVTTTMVITSTLIYFVARDRWRWSRLAGSLLAAALLVIDLTFFVANAVKIPHGGWFPLAAGVLIFTVMTTWATGRQLVARQLSQNQLPLSKFFDSITARPPLRVPGTAVFMTAHPAGTPPILVHHLTHNKVLHQQIVLLTVTIADVPMVEPESAIQVEPLHDGFWRVVATFGFMDQPDVPKALALAREHGLTGGSADITYYLAHLSLFSDGVSKLGMMGWREKLFIFLSRNARRATSFFEIPADRVVEIGMQLEI